MRNIKAIINRQRWLCNAFQLFGSRPPFPLLLLVHLTTNCQCSCSICYQSQDPTFPRTPGKIDLQLFEKMLDQVSGFLFKPLIHLYGGEPLMHPDFPKLLDLLTDKGFKATLNTNGEYLGKHAEALAGGPVRVINVSLDALGQQHDKQRGRPGLFELAISGMEKLRRLDEKIFLNVNYVVSEQNAAGLAEDLAGFTEIFKDLRIDYFSIEHLAFARASAASAKAIDVAALKNQLALIGARQYPFPVSATPIIRSADLAGYYGSMTPLGRVNCNVPWIALNIFPSGLVTPGGAMFACLAPVGDLNEATLPQIWNGEKMRRFRKMIKSSMPEDCLRCCHTLHYSPIIGCRSAVVSAQN